MAKAASKPTSQNSLRSPKKPTPTKRCKPSGTSSMRSPKKPTPSKN
nr:MAG TPA: hypothetical protein [Caudoviricetes sp.]